MTRLLNSGDLKGLAKLFNSHMIDDCALKLDVTVPEINISSFLSIYQLLGERHPDSMRVVRTTQVVENSITSMCYMKFTDCKYINDSMNRTVSDPLFKAIFKNGRNGWADLFDKNLKTKEELSEITSLLACEDNLEIHGRIRLSLSFNGVTKKIESLVCETEFTEIKAVVLDLE